MSALFTAFLLVTSGVVAAEPVDNESTERLSYTGKPPVRPVPDKQGWIELVDPTTAKHGRQFVSFGTGTAAFHRLRVDAHSGRFYLQQIRIDFRDGGRKVVRLDTRLSSKGKGKRSVEIDLGGARQITQLLVITDPGHAGTYTVHAGVADAAVAKR